MAESAKLRLVRCPKCQKLLPELEDYSVYQCGGCGVVLRAKNKNHEADSSSEKLEEERVKAASTESRNLSEKKTLDSTNASASDVVPNAGSSRHQEKSVEENKGVNAEQSQDNVAKLIVENGHGMKIDRDDKDKDSNSRSGSLKSAPISDRRSQETMEANEFGNGTSRTGYEGVRLSTSIHQDEPVSSYDFRERLSNLNLRDEPGTGLSLNQDRAELLRKLDELKEQLGRSCNEADKAKEKGPLDGRVHPLDPYRATDLRSSMASLGPDKAFLQQSKNIHGPPYFHHYPEPFYNNVREMPMPGLYPTVHNSMPIPGYGDPLEFQMHRRASQQFPGQYPHQPHPYYSGQYIDASHDLFEPYSQNAIFHQPACSCFHCYEQHRRAPAPVLPTAFSNQRCGDVPYNPGLYRNEEVRAFGLHNHRTRTMVPPPPPSSSYSHLNPATAGFTRGRPPKVVLSGASTRCRPVAGGAPFLMCHNCFELLQLPKKILLMSKKHQRLRCGACSTVIDFEVINKKLVLSFVAEESKQISTEVDGSSNKAVQDGASHSHGHRNQMNAAYSSDDYDNSGYEFYSLDRDPIEFSTRQGFNSSKPHEMQSFASSSPSASEDENSSDSLKPPLAGSPLQDHFEYSSSNHAIHRFGMGNRSARLEQEKAIPNKVTTRQNSLKEAVVATEMDVSYNEYSNTGLSQESRETNREEDRPKTNKGGGESFFANIIKKSFKDLTRSGQNENHRKSNNVLVNGHPISERSVKKAERLAGTIQPGSYWYDHRAGFWGVMDGPCLGIIPPFIEELNCPMPDNCAGGTTGIFVNGRELHQKDLDLLASRGLPTERDRSYIIDVSGRVVDEDTGEELDGLGKLAPTVEKLKRGFGMRSPRVAA